MKRFSYHSTTLFALSLCASSVLLSADMSHAASTTEVSHHSATGAICQTVSHSRAQASYSSSGVLFNQDEQNVLKITCPLHRAFTTLGSELETVVISFTDEHSTKDLRCRVGARDNFRGIHRRTSYKSSKGRRTRDFIDFFESSLDSINTSSVSVPYYLYCEIPEKSSFRISSITSIRWVEVRRTNPEP